MARKRKFRIKPGRIILLLLILYVGITLFNQKKLANKLLSKKESIARENEEIQREIDQMTKEIEDSDSLQFIEKIARELGMVKPREIIYIDETKQKKSFLRFKKEDN